MKKVLIIVLLFLLLSLGFIVIRFGNALTQEGNPIPYITSIMKLELSNNGYEQVADTMNGKRYVSEYEKKYPHGITIEFMKDKGWEFKEQIGSGFVFEKDKEDITISTRMYSKHYFIWDVPNGVFN